MCGISAYCRRNYYIIFTGIFLPNCRSSIEARENEVIPTNTNQISEVTTKDKSEQNLQAEEENGFYESKLLQNGMKLILRRIQEPAFPSNLKCNFCNKMLSSNSNVNKHIKNVHRACAICNIRFSSQEILKEHMRDKHEKKTQKLN